MPNPSGISVGKGPRPNAAQLWSARSGLMELKSRTGLLPSASTADVIVSMIGTTEPKTPDFSWQGNSGNPPQHPRSLDQNAS